MLQGWRPLRQRRVSNHDTNHPACWTWNQQWAMVSRALQDDKEKASFAPFVVKMVKKPSFQTPKWRPSATTFEAFVKTVWQIIYESRFMARAISTTYHVCVIKAARSSWDLLRWKSMPLQTCFVTTTISSLVDPWRASSSLYGVRVETVDRDNWMKAKTSIPWWLVANAVPRLALLTDVLGMKVGPALSTFEMPTRVTKWPGFNSWNLQSTNNVPDADISWKKEVDAITWRAHVDTNSVGFAWVLIADQRESLPLTIQHIGPPVVITIEH